jgi:hypothetical protein
MHGSPYIDDYEGFKLKKTCNNVLMYFEHAFGPSKILIHLI